MTIDPLNVQTIAAIATAVAAEQGGIAVIRVSGPAASKVVQSIVSIPGNQVWASHHVLYGHVMDKTGKEQVDEVLVLIMNAPRSFTGEDIVEIHCHGGLIAVQRVLEQVLAHPEVRRAMPGEFSQRAVMNGRLSLTQAEAIRDLVAARTYRAAELAMTGVDGGIQRHINKLRETLLDQLSEIEARVDFEDELPILDGQKLLDELIKVQLALQGLVEDANRGALLRQGLKVAIIGRPNVGKSSLLNRLSRRERAIVADLPGTTRDLLESEIVLEGVPIMLLDTAGIRSTNDELEQLGIARSHKALMAADVAILVFDLALGWREEDDALLANIPTGIPKLIVGNKADIANQSIITLPKGHAAKGINYVTYSAHTNEGEQALIAELLEKCGTAQTEGLIFALNERQRDLATLAAAALERTKEVAKQKLPWDFWSIDLREAIKKLGELTGEEITEPVLDRIFSRFCIGK